MSVVRCRDRNSHGDVPGNILAVLDGDTIYLRCSDRKCRSWTRVQISIPGVNLNFADAAIQTEVVSVGRFDPTRQAAVEC